MKIKIIRENKTSRQWNVYYPTIGLIIVVLLSILFGSLLTTFFCIATSIVIIYFIIVPAYKLGIYIDDDGLTQKSKRGTYFYKWDDVNLVTHEIRVKYHVLSLHEGERSLHISLENYHPEKIVKEVLRHVPKEKVALESRKNLEQYYYYGKTIERK